MKMFNFRAKVKIVGAIFFVVILLAVAVLGGTRIIKDTRDNSVTFITNSNGGHWPATGANIVVAYADLTGGGTVTLPGNTTITINSGFIPKQNTTLDFNGCKLLLDDLGVEQTYMINMYNDNVTLINPWLDMDRANNEVNPAAGNQIAIYFNGRSHNCEIIGGLIENACQSGIGGATHNATIIGTKILDSGEHGVYLSQSSDVYMQGVEVIEPGINNTKRGYGFKLDKVKSVTVENAYVEYTGHEVFPADNSIGFVIGGGSRSVKVHGRVVNAEYGIYAGASSYNGRPCENIDISLTCEGCKNFANAPTPSNLIGCHVYDCFMDLGTFKLDAFGEHAIIERLTVNHSGSSPHTTNCFLNSASKNVSFTLKDSFIRAKGGYIVSILTGYDLVIENNVFINDNSIASNYCCLRLSDVSGNIKVCDNIFRGGSHWSLRYDSANENFLCSGNRFREPYAGDTPGTAIEWIKYPTYRDIRGNINETDFTTSINVGGRFINASYDEMFTYIRNTKGNYWEPTSANIQNAIDDQAGEGKIYVPSGDFTVVCLYINHTGVELYGQGSGHWGDNGATTLRSTSNNNILDMTNGGVKSGILISGIKFAQNSRTYTGDAIVLGNCHSAKILECGFHDINGSAIHVTGPAFSFTVDECNFQHCGNNISSPKKATIFLDYIDSQITAVKITNSVFEVDEGYAINGNASDGVIENNFFEDNGTLIDTGTIAGKLQKFHIVNNYFIDFDTTDSGTCAAIYVDNPGISVIDNKIYYYYRGIEGTGSGYQCEFMDNLIVSTLETGIYSTGGKCVITDNILRDGGTLAGYRKGAIYISGDDSIVGDNLIFDWDSVGIRISGSDNSIFHDNNIFNSVTTDMDYGIWASSTSDAIFVHHNYFEGMQVAGILDETVDADTVILDNRGFDHNSLFPFYKQNTAPTINDNCTAYWYDLDDDFMYQITNSYGSVWYVNMTKTI